MLGILTGRSWCYRNSFQLIYSSYFVMFTVAMIKGTTQSVPQTLKGRGSDLPLQMKYLPQSHAHAFQWAPRQSKESHVEKNWGHGVVLIVCQSDLSTILMSALDSIFFNIKWNSATHLLVWSCFDFTHWQIKKLRPLSNIKYGWNIQFFGFF